MWGFRTLAAQRDYSYGRQFQEKFFHVEAAYIHGSRKGGVGSELGSP